ncbi:MAG: DUF177 domain-containing protein [Bacteroidales bacterium]|jgi:uncharacterized metal-binding protein YceD (DUF177 family)|nr:DUF177 domain-containing protein [Bacteroidales bacterium]MBP5418413.1 DUF177 domain-containing protein [Bacteroidales bacterium]MCR5696218.1 DUF177 domain-containing protein [Marinilabiliaceae bacterium]
MKTDDNALRIQYKGLANGEHQFKFDIHRDFFENLEDSLIEDGDFVVNLDMTKTDQMLKMRFDISGTIHTTCDVCLDPMDYQVEHCGGDIIVKFGDHEEEISDELYMIDENDNDISVAQYIYEFIAVAMPIRFKHEEDSEGNSLCNPEMIKKLQQYSANKETKAPSTDPRWDALKGLVNKNNN